MLKASPPDRNEVKMKRNLRQRPTFLGPVVGKPKQCPGIVYRWVEHDEAAAAEANYVCVCEHIREQCHVCVERHKACESVLSVSCQICSWFQTCM